MMGGNQAHAGRVLARTGVSQWVGDNTEWCQWLQKSCIRLKGAVRCQGGYIEDN